MASNTYKSYLMKGTGTTTITYTKLVDIKSYPDMGGNTDGLETTTLSDPNQTYIPGIVQIDASGLQFTCNYDKTEYTTLNGLKDTETPYALWFGANSSGQPDGTLGKWSFKGFLDVGLVGKGVNEVREMNVNIRPSTPIEFA